jgi:hypothetical protein
MKVLQHGTWHDQWSLEVVCEGCGALLLVEEQNVKPTKGKKDKFECLCADCGKVIDIASELIHPRIVKHLEPTREYTSYYD